MKCRSVACIWPETPPAHRVTAAAALNQPPTLYTGGSDGSIIWWNLSFSDSDSNAEIKAVAMLCGHAASISDLAICYPIGNSGGERIDDSGDDAGSSGALFSACTDGVMCVWSRGSGHCRRRRKLPPWVGSPSIVRTLPVSPRYVCIGCCFVDHAVHLSDYHSNNSVEEERKHSMCTIVVVDTYSLAIVQTVFHGNLLIGPLKFMDVVFSGEDGERHSVLMADSVGRVQLVPILKDSNPDVEGGSGLYKSSQLEAAICGSDLGGGSPVVFVATCGNLIAHVLKDRCIFRLLTSDSIIGEISFLENYTLSHVLGGIFLGNGDTTHMQNCLNASENICENFAVWSSTGSAIMYRISYLNGIFKYEPLCEIPASKPFDVKKLVSFIQLKNFVLRIESVCFCVEEPLQWKPNITIWPLCQKHHNHKQLSHECKMLGQSDSFADWVASSTLPCKSDDPIYRETEITSSQISVPSAEKEHNNQKNDEKYSFLHNGSAVSSSMVISESLLVPYAVVYGFFSGEIEVVFLDVFRGPDSEGASPHCDGDSYTSRQYLLGHTGAVLCLAAHRMIGSCKGWSFSHVLVSGSMDSTVRIWDLDTGNLITVMHQHVAPVRQIIFPPVQTERPWSDCFLSVGEDSCVTLASLETLRVERIFPGHPSYPGKVVWDGVRGYIACLCPSSSGTSNVLDVLYIWDVKTGARERVLRGTASHSMLDHFCKGISVNSISGSILNANTSVSSLLLPIIDDGSFSQSELSNVEMSAHSSNRISGMTSTLKPTTLPTDRNNRNFENRSSSILSFLQANKHSIRCSCPFPGIASISFDLASLMFSYQNSGTISNGSDKQQNTSAKEPEAGTPSPRHVIVDDSNGVAASKIEEHEWVKSLEEYLLRFSLSFLHLWNIDSELDKLLITDMKLKRPVNFIVASGLQGDKGSLTLTFPGSSAILELWKSSSEFCALRSLTVVSIAQRMISLSHSSSSAGSALAAFYTRNFADRIPDIKPPLLQLLVSFWQDDSEHVRMAARTLFHCAASQAIPLPLCGQKANDHVNLVRSLIGIGENRDEISRIGGTSAGDLACNMSSELQGMSQAEESHDNSLEAQGITQAEQAKIVAWLESFELQDWISCVGGTSQDAMTSHIIVAAALAVWYPSIVKPSLATLVIHPLIKLVMAMNGKYSSTAAELLAEGMESTWKSCCSSEIPRLIGDIFFQVEVVSGSSSSSAGHRSAVPSSIREALVGILLPSLAMADILAFLTVIESQIWSTASDSPVHLIALTILIRILRASPRVLAQHLDKVINFILHTMDPSNTVMRKTCLQSSMMALKEVVRVFPMVALNNASTRLAVGDAIGEINNASISVYDMQSVRKIKVLDARAPMGLPNLLSGASNITVTTVISALSFSPDGEGLVAFSEHGFMIRWWSLESVWWEKLSRNVVPVQCTKLIFVPPWEGFSPNSSRSSIMASIIGNDKQANLEENAKGLTDAETVKLLVHNLDLSYSLEWAAERKILLTRQGQELGIFPL